MPTINLVLKEPAWPDLAERDDLIKYRESFGLTALEHGMESGKPSAMFRFDLDDGHVLLAETSLAVLAGAVRGLVAKYDPELFEPLPPTAEVIVTGLTGLLAMLPGEHVLMTASMVGTDGKMRHVAHITRDGEHILEAQGHTFIEALEELSERVAENLTRHEDEHHDGLVN
jgi:hypothetical protein